MKVKGTLMANSCRIDKFVIDKVTGAVSVEFTDGPPPLSPLPSGQGASWATSADFANDLAALEEKLTSTDRALLAIVAYTKATGDAQLRNEGSVKGRTVTVDFSAGGSNVLVNG